jgi:uncharacterized protein (DUF1810 family)
LNVKNPEKPDRYNLTRFVDAQAPIYARALSELRAGKKRSHWMWFIFPQVAGLGFSSMAQRYAIDSPAEAEAYLRHRVLGPRLIQCAEALLAVSGRTIQEVMGYPDYLKLQSSMTLFAAISPANSVFEKVLKKFYGGEIDKKTIRFLTGRRT